MITLTASIASSKHLISGALVLALASCNSYNDRTKRFASQWERADFQGSAVEACELAEKSPSRDRVVSQLEKGAALHAAGRLDEALTAYDQADAFAKEQDQQADVRVGEILSGTMTNLSYLPYRLRWYDRIMMHNSKALILMEMGRWDDARAELRATEFAQQDAQRQSQSEVAEREEIETKASQDKTYKSEKTLNDPGVKNKLDQTYGDLEHYKAIKDFDNPAAVLVNAIYFLHRPADSSDLDRSRASLRRLAAMCAKHQPDLKKTIDAMLQRIDTKQAEPPCVHVIVETGRAPSRDQIRIDLPVFIVDGTVPYVGAAFPTLVPHPLSSSGFSIRAGNQDAGTASLVNVDDIVATHFSQELPMVITRTLISTAAKAAATWGAKKAAKAAAGKDNAVWAGLAADVIGAGYQIAMNEADRRTWLTLPREVLYARMPMPEDGRLGIRSGSGATEYIDLKSGRSLLILVKAPSPAGPFSIHQIVLEAKQGNPK